MIKAASVPGKSEIARRLLVKIQYIVETEIAARPETAKARISNPVTQQKIRLAHLPN